MGDITNPKILWLKGGLFVLLGTMATGLVLAESPHWGTAVLLALAVWAFCRAYYFAFYVVGHYVDPKFKFAGLLDFARYALGRKKR